MGRLKQIIAAPEALNKLKSMNGINQQIKTLIDKITNTTNTNKYKKNYIIIFCCFFRIHSRITFWQGPMPNKKNYIHKRLAVGSDFLQIAADTFTKLPEHSPIKVDCFKGRSLP